MNKAEQSVIQGQYKKPWINYKEWKFFKLFLKGPVDFILPIRLGYPREAIKAEGFDIAMQEIYDHRIKMSEQFQKRRLENERFRNELLQVLELSKQCSNIVNFYRNQIPFDSYKEFMLSEEMTAYLPIELGEFLKKKL